MAGKRKLKPHELREQGKRNYLSRSVGTKPQKKRFLIVCEGEKTEPNYFRALNAIWKIPAFVEVVGGAGVTLSVVDKAIELRNEDKDGYDEIWGVFDRDSFPPVNIHAAFDKAKSENIKIAFSNEAFEFWYLLHYAFRDTGMNRTEYGDSLTAYMGRKYEKNDPSMFELLRQKLPDAVRHAKGIAKGFEMYDHSLVNQNPYTGVYLLVKALLPEAKDTLKETLRSCNMQEKEYIELNKVFTI